jgi:hypothetical protein
LQAFLAIIGGIALAIVGLLALGLFLLRWKFRTVLRQFDDVGEAVGVAGYVVPPMQIRLRPDNSYEWRDQAQVHAVGDELSERGFIRIGTFNSEPVTVPIEAWHDPQQSIYATICEDSDTGVWLDVLSLGEDDSSFTVSSGPGDQFVRPSDFQLKQLPGGTPTDVLSWFFENRPEHQARRTSAESFATTFEDLWQRMMNVRTEQGPPSEDEIRRVCHAQGDGELQLEVVERIREMWQSQINDAVERQIREAFLEGTQLTALEWDRIRDRVVFVHDDLTAEELAAMIDLEWDGSVDDLDDAYDVAEERAYELLGEASARSVFIRMNSELHAASRFEKIGAVTHPAAADVYVGPA